MTTLKTTLNFDLAVKFVSALDMQTASAPGGLKRNYTLTDGAGLNAANRVFTDRRTISASSSENLDLAASLVDAFGATITFARIKGIVVAASSANTNNVLVGGAASNGFVNWVSDSSDVLVVRPGGLFVLLAQHATGYAVTASTGDILKVANSSSGSPVSYDIALIGAAS